MQNIDEQNNQAQQPDANRKPNTRFSDYQVDEAYFLERSKEFKKFYKKAVSEQDKPYAAVRVGDLRAFLQKPATPANPNPSPIPDEAYMVMFFGSYKKLGKDEAYYKEKWKDDPVHKDDYKHIKDCPTVLIAFAKDLERDASKLFSFADFLAVVDPCVICPPPGGCF